MNYRASRGVSRWKFIRRAPRTCTFWGLRAPALMYLPWNRCPRNRATRTRCCDFFCFRSGIPVRGHEMRCGFSRGPIGIGRHRSFDAAIGRDRAATEKNCNYRRDARSICRRVSWMPEKPVYNPADVFVGKSNVNRLWRDFEGGEWKLVKDFMRVVCEVCDIPFTHARKIKSEIFSVRTISRWS